jgi:hypothetical protein
VERLIAIALFVCGCAKATPPPPKIYVAPSEIGAVGRVAQASTPAEIASAVAELPADPVTASLSARVTDLPKEPTRDVPVYDGAIRITGVAEAAYEQCADGGVIVRTKHVVLVHVRGDFASGRVDAYGVRKRAMSSDATEDATLDSGEIAPLYDRVDRARYDDDQRDFARASTAAEADYQTALDDYRGAQAAYPEALAQFKTRERDLENQRDGLLVAHAEDLRAVAKEARSLLGRLLVR